MFTLVVLGIILALAFDFLNGMNDAGNSIATIVSTRVLSPLQAVVWAAFFNFAAAFIFGLHVANTVGKGIVEQDVINEYFVLCALTGAIVWVYTCARYGLPTSVSHALIGGLIGPAIVANGTQSLIASGIIKVALFIFISPMLGMILGYLLMVLTLHVFKNKSPYRVDSFFRAMQLFSSAIFSLGHGSNDAQKTMGIIAMLLYSSGYITEFHIPFWVVLAAYSAISLGTLTGAWKVIKTLGVGLTHLKPVAGFCAETAGAISVISSSMMGIPVSTTHTITGAIAGVGMTKRVSAVRWNLASHIVIAWFLTIPATLVISGFLYWIVKLFIR